MRMEPDSLNQPWGGKIPTVREADTTESKKIKAISIGPVTAVDSTALIDLIV